MVPCHIPSPDPPAAAPSEPTSGTSANHDELPILPAVDARGAPHGAEAGLSLQVSIDNHPAASESALLRGPIVTESSLRPWLAALAFSLAAHLALGLALNLMPPTAEQGPAASLTVSFVAATSGDGSNPQKPDSLPAEHPRQTPPQASPPPAHEAPKSTTMNQTVPTEPKPRNESPQHAAVERLEAPPPMPAAEPQPKPDKPAFEPPSRPRSTPHATGSAAAVAMTPTLPRSASAPIKRGVGDSGGTDTDLRAARPAPGNPKPHYPALARRRGDEGHVLIQTEIQADGRTGRIEVKQSSGHRVLDEAAVATVKDWRFLPARRAGRAVSTTVEIPISFRLDDAGR